MQTRLFMLLLRPSLISSLATITGATVLIGVMNWPYFTYTTALYPILYGESGVITVLEQSPSLTRGITQIIDQNPLFYGTVIVIAAAAAGWGTLLIIRALKSGVQSVESLGNEGQRRDTLQHLLVRVFVLGMWIIYAALSISIIIPFCLLFSRIGAEFITTPNGLLMNAGAFALLALTLHLHIIFLRMLLLRPRAFGSHALIEDVTYARH